MQESDAVWMWSEAFVQALKGAMLDPPSDPAGFDPKEAVARLRQAASAAGRDFSTLSITVFGAPADEAILAQYREAGIQRAVLAIPDLTPGEIMGVLDKYARLGS